LKIKNSKNFISSDVAENHQRSQIEQLIDGITNNNDNPCKVEINEDGIAQGIS